MAAEDYPLIIWDDGSSPLTRVSYLPYGEFIDNPPADFGLPGAAFLPDDGTAYTQAEQTLAKMNTGRSVDRSRSEFVLKMRSQDIVGPDAGDVVVVFGTLDLRSVMCAAVSPVSQTVQPFYNPAVDRTRSFLLRCPGNSIMYPAGEIPPAQDPPVDTTFDFYLIKTGLAEVVEIIAQRTPMTLPIPPQSKATPKVARRWETNPKTSVRGQYLGASPRPIAGELTLDMENLTRDWIEIYWEPFREHVSQGGVFAYIDREGEEPAYCYASSNVPAPLIRAGGYGKVMLRAGVAVV